MIKLNQTSNAKMKAIKMSCLESCDLIKEFFCIICEQLLCIHQKNEHKMKNSDHTIQVADEMTRTRIIQNKYKNTLNNEKQNLIHKLTISQCSVISNLYRRTRMQVDAIKNSKNLEDLKMIESGLENLLQFFVEAGMLKNGIYEVSTSGVVEFTLSLDKKNEEIEYLKDLIQKIEAEKYEIKHEKEIIAQNYNKIKKDLRKYEKLNTNLRDINYIRNLLNELEKNSKISQGIFRKGVRVLGC